MRADVILKMSRVRIPGEITTEHPAAVGEPRFVPWRTIGRWVVDCPYRLDEGFQMVIVPRSGRQTQQLTEVLEPIPAIRVAKPARWLDRQERQVKTTLDQESWHYLQDLAERDGVSLATFLRSALLRELTRRGWRPDGDPQT